MADILHYMGAWRDPGDLQPGQCTMRRGTRDNQSWWMLWFCVPQDSDGQPLLAAVPVNVGGPYAENAPGGKTWGFNAVGSGTHQWQISPSINVLENRNINPGEHTERSLWHRTPMVVNVPDGEPWAGGEPWQQCSDQIQTGSRRIRLVHQIGVKAVLRIYWDRMGRKDDDHIDYKNTCPNSYGRGHPGGHNASAYIGRKEGVFEYGTFGNSEDYPTGWPTRCDNCGALVPGDELTGRLPNEGEELVHGSRQVFESRLYSTATGSPEVCDAWWADAHDLGECWNWDNCGGRHLIVCLPDGHHWDVMGRASNCARKEDRTHRCWVISGDVGAGTLTIGKGGDTCPAGGGSIDTGRYHGSIANGVLSP